MRMIPIYALSAWVELSSSTERCRRPG